MLNALKKLIQGDTQFTSTNIETGGVASAEIAALAVTSAKIGSAAITSTKIDASAVTGAKIATDAVSGLHIAASAVAAGELKYKLNTYSLAGDAVGALSAASVTYTIVTTGKAIGHFMTKQTSHANTPLIIQGTNSISISVAQALIGTDLVEGVVITIEA